MRIRSLMLGLIGLSSLVTFPAFALDQIGFMHTLFSVMQVKSFTLAGGQGLGSGVLLSKNEVITNCHVLRDAKDSWVALGEDTFRVLSYQADPVHDLCLLVTEPLPGNPATIAVKPLKRGDEVFAVGHSNGVASASASRGRVQSLFIHDDANLIRSDARFALGASGSGLFDTEGNLVGINTFKTVGDVAYYYALPVAWIDNVRKMPVKTKFPIEGQAFWELTGNDKPYFLQVARPELDGNWLEVLAISQNWVKAQPNNPEGIYELGLAYEGLGKFADAKSCYEQVTTLNPKHVDALFHQGLLASKQHDQIAVDKIREAIAQADPNFIEPYNRATSAIK